MLSVTQKAKLYANIPAILSSYICDKYLRDRFFGPTVYPSETISFLTEGIRKGYGTWAPVSSYINADTKDWDDYFGEREEANLSVTLWSDTEEQLREIANSLEVLIKIDRLGLDWPTDHMKFSRFKNITLLPPYADEFNRIHSWRAVLDFTIEYEWAELELAPAIKAFTYLFTAGDLEVPNTAAPPLSPPLYSFKGNTWVKTYGPLSSYMPGSYGMDLNIRGWHASYEARFAACVKNKSATFGMAIEIIV